MTIACGCSSAESATAVMTTISGVASQLSVIPGGTITARIGGRAVLAMSYLVGAVSLAGYLLRKTAFLHLMMGLMARVIVHRSRYAFTTSFTAVLGLVALFGIGQGLMAGAVGAVSAKSLPSLESAGRDMNILVTGPVFGQSKSTSNRVSQAIRRCFRSVGPSAQIACDYSGTASGWWIVDLIREQALEP